MTDSPEIVQGSGKTLRVPPASPGSYQDLDTFVGPRGRPPESRWAYSFNETYFNYTNWSFFTKFSPVSSLQKHHYFPGAKSTQSHEMPGFQVHCDDLSNNTNNSTLCHCLCFHVRVMAGHATGLLQKQAGCSCIILACESWVFPLEGHIYCLKGGRGASP